MKYTNVDRIQDLLKGQLHFGQSPHIGGQTIDMELAKRTIQQVEALTDAILGMIYELPLLHEQPMVSEIVEDWIVRRLGSQVPMQGTDISQQPQYIAGRAEYLLMLLTAGHNIAIPGVPPVMSAPGAVTPQPIRLPGEILKAVPPDTITRNVTVVGKSTSLERDRQWADFGPTGQGRRAMGAEDFIWEYRRGYTN